MGYYMLHEKSYTKLSMSWSITETRKHSIGYNMAQTLYVNETHFGMGLIYILLIRL